MNLTEMLCININPTYHKWLIWWHCTI